MDEKFAAGKNQSDTSFPFTRFRDLGALEDEVAENGEKWESIKDLLDRTRESQEGIKRTILDDKVERAKEIGDLKTWLAGEFGELRGERKAEQRATSTTQWTWQLVVSTGLALAALVLSAWVALKH